jgi:hypothetical protein
MALILKISLHVVGTVGKGKQMQVGQVQLRKCNWRLEITIFSTVPFCLHDAGKYKHRVHLVAKSATVHSKFAWIWNKLSFCSQPMVIWDNILKGLLSSF